jgi:hypothetical protein
VDRELLSNMIHLSVTKYTKKPMAIDVPRLLNQLCCWMSAVEVAVESPEVEGGCNLKGKVGMWGMGYHRREMGGDYLFGEDEALYRVCPKSRQHRPYPHSGKTQDQNRHQQ